MLLAAELIKLGPQTALLDQPYVEVELFANGVGLGPYDSGLGIYPYNWWLLDTGANSALAVSDAAAELMVNGLMSQGTYEEIGVGGVTVFNVSNPCRVDFRGSDGLTHTLPQTADDHRLMFSDEVELAGMPASLGGIPGIIGMPAMINRVTTLDMTQWATATDIFDLEPIAVTFSDTVPPGNGHRYSVALDTRVTFDPHDGLPPGSPPDAPLPMWAPVPFLTATAEYNGTRVSGGFLLDTGAQFSLISTDMAFSLGLDEDGDGSLRDDAFDVLPIGGIGGTIEVPLMLIDALRVPTEQGQDLIWYDPSEEPLGVQVLVLDILPGIDGIFGVDFLTSGIDLLIDPYTFEIEMIGATYFERIHFDFRDLDEGSGRMYFDLSPQYDVITQEGDAPVADAGGPYLVDTGQPLTLDGSASWDPNESSGDQIVLYEWEINGDGLFDDAASTEPVVVISWSQLAGLPQPGIPNPIQLRVTDTTGLTDTDATTVTIILAQALGSVSFQELENLDPSGGDLWYRLQASRDGLLTLDAAVAGGADLAGLSLHGTDLNAPPLAVSQVVEGRQRIDYQAAAGQTYYFKLSGTSTDVDLRLANLVQHVGAELTVAGTAGDDRLEFSAASSRRVTVNGVAYDFPPSELAAVWFDGGAGADSAILTGSSGNDYATLRKGAVDLVGADYQVHATNVETISVDAGAGTAQTATLYDSSANDTFVARRREASITDALWYTNSVTGFSTI
ncbi:MAG: aspartyl protease family protein, partial [Thermoguttaceae bacterium]